MKPFEKVTLIIGILIGLLGICATIMYPWPASWIANRFDLPMLVAQIITVACVLVIVGVPIGYIIHRDGWPSIIKRVPQNRPPTTSITIPTNAVSKDFIYSCLVETLSAFEKSLASRYRELHFEHELTRRNLRYHRQKIRELIDMNLLDCQAPWFPHLPDTELQPHFGARKKIDKNIEVIYSTLRVWHIRPKYVIALAGHQAGALLRIVRKELNTLKKLKPREKN